MAAILLLATSRPVAKLRENPELARSAFEEAIRLSRRYRRFFRTTTDEALLRLCGSPRAKVLMPHDRQSYPRRWAEADSFDITRNTTGHVGFGAGIHACVGQLIARLEGEIILTLLATRVHSLQLTAPPTAHLNNTLRGWSSIPISVQAS